MVNLDIQWSEPYQWEDKDGNLKHRRIWVIPKDYLSAFFTFWKGAKFRMWGEGYSVNKVDDSWLLIETHDSPNDFKAFGDTQKATPTVAEPEEFWTAPYKLKDESGLRPWQVGSVSSIITTLNKWGAAIDGSDVGVGKTYVACAVARELGMKVVVVCPKAVMEPWRRVLCNHFKMKDALVDIINYEQLRIGKTSSKVASYITNRKTHRDKFTWKISKDTLIIWDESQKLKNWKTKNSKTCIEAQKQGYKMLFCSATNATNPLELRTVGTALKLFKGATAYYQWCYENGVSKGNWGLEFTKDMALRKKYLKKLHHDIFVQRGVRLSRDTIPDFPESEIIAECYNMDDEDVKKINQYHADMEMELKRLAKIVIRDKASELTAILRERQQVELQKVPLMVEMVEEGIEQGMSVVVFVNFTETLNALSKRLNTKCIFDGKTPDKVRQQNVDDFQEDKERVILVNVQSGGAGLTLGDMTGKYPRLALISPSYSAVIMRQCTGRVWRESSKTKSIQKILFVSGTVEEDVCDSVKAKLDNLDLLNDGDLSTSQDMYRRKEVI